GLEDSTHPTNSRRLRRGATAPQPAGAEQAGAEGRQRQRAGLGGVLRRRRRRGGGAWGVGDAGGVGGRRRRRGARGRLQDGVAGTGGLMEAGAEGVGRGGGRGGGE